MLQLKNIVKVYQAGDQTVTALDGLSLDFSKKGFVSILGPSGCGKTTLLNIIGGLDRYTEGDLIINGVSTKDYKDKDWDAYRNNSIGFVFQSYNLISHQSVLQNVELALTLSGVSAKERKARAIEVLNLVGLGDQLNKKPNQLSGGQMQRVAIARAMVNNPDILLADEPTGALDSKTSVQIMELLKEISQDKLVIMVTHNAELADEYSTRIVRLSDGVLVGDTGDIVADIETQEQPKEENESIVEQDADRPNKKIKKPKTSMSFWTAFLLSLKNLLTKKGRTIITSFAGSIGIIGIALVLSLSTGVNQYISNAQKEFMDSSAIQISANTYDIDALMNMMEESSEEADSKVLFPTEQAVYGYAPLEDMANNLIIKNNLDQEFIDYFESNLPAETYNSLDYIKSVNFNIIRDMGDGVYQAGENGKPITLSNMMSNADFVTANYEAIAGSYSTDKYALNLVVDQSNQIDKSVLTLLGLSTTGDDNAVSFQDVLASQLRVAHNDDYYQKVGTAQYVTKSSAELGAVYNNTTAGHTKVLRVASILRIKNQDEVSPILQRGLYYNLSLADEILAEASTSQIVNDINTSPNTVRLNGKRFDVTGVSSGLAGMANMYNSLTEVNADSSVKDIVIYPVNYQAREEVARIVEQWNTALAEEDKDTKSIKYSDPLDTAFSLIDEMMNIVTYALIAFISISLIVSTVMIGVITYVSVIERTKEIGILRSVGARKKDISRVFNAETFIIGGTAGIIGVIVSYLLIIPINIILEHLVDIAGLCYLHPLAAVVLVAISIGLTLISGFFPAKIAAKRDPILALRSE